MPDWLAQLIGPVAGGAVSGLMMLAGLRVEVRALNDKVAAAIGTAQRAHVRLDDHINQHVKH